MEAVLLGVARRNRDRSSRSSGREVMGGGCGEGRMCGARRKRRGRERRKRTAAGINGDGDDEDEDGRYFI